MIFIEKNIENKVHKTDLAYYHKLVDNVISTRKSFINALEKFICFSVIYGGVNSSEKDKLRCKKLYDISNNAFEKYKYAVIIYVSFLELLENGLL